MWPPSVNLTAVAGGIIKAEGTANATAYNSAPALQASLP
jgi:hypothetical protein